MKKLMVLGGAVIVASIFSGCSTVDPLTVPQTARDLQVYKPETAHKVNDRTTRYKIAIRSQAVKNEKDAEVYEAHMSNEMESSLANNFTNLGWFDTVDRKNGVVLNAEAMLDKTLDPAGLSGAEYVLIAESRLSFLAKQGWKHTHIASKAAGAEVMTDFRLIELSTKTPVLVKKFVSKVPDIEKGGLKTAITRATNMNAKKFARVIAARFLPEVRVIQTRGDGRYAQVGMGKNYQATPVVKEWRWWPYKYLPLCYVKQEVTPAAKVDFFVWDDKDQSVFAHGTVIQSDNKKAWVEVDNSETAGVMKGHNAKVAEEVEGTDAALE